MQTICLTTDSGAPLSERVQVATSFISRVRGLLGRRELSPDEGMLLQPGGSIHTLGMRFAIDVVFLNSDMRVMRVCAHVRPWRGRLAPRGTRGVLELPAGRAANAGLEVGHTIETTTQAHELTGVV